MGAAMKRIIAMADGKTNQKKLLCFKMRPHSPVGQFTGLEGARPGAAQPPTASHCLVEEAALTCRCRVSGFDVRQRLLGAFIALQEVCDIVTECRVQKAVMR